MLSLYYCNNLL